MKTRADIIKKFILKEIPNHPRDIVKVTAQKFNVTRVTVHRHLETLEKTGEITKTGKTKNIIYGLAAEEKKFFSRRITPGLAEDEVWRTELKAEFTDLPENVQHILNYGFTEMFNNAVDHSGGKEITVYYRRENGRIILGVHDDGIGIFKKIRDGFHLENERMSILELTKGKVTTDPKRHSGEGIFFTSRAFDEFAILANHLCYIKKNLQDDWFVQGEKNQSGTWIRMSIGVQSQRTLESVFQAYQLAGRGSFDKTHVLVELSKTEEEEFISRSQAKRVLLGLNKFSHILLDFSHVKVVGQGFVDEVFRVFKNQHPDISMEYQNANEDVRFMIERSISKPRA